MDGVQPYVLVRESTTKDKRSVPLRRDLAALVREIRPAEVTPTTSVFFGRFPTFVIEGNSDQVPQATVDGALSPFLALSATSGQRSEMVVGTGFEPVERFLQACVELATSVSAETADTQLRTQKLGELREVIEAWPKLSVELRAVVLAVTRAVAK